MEGKRGSKRRREESVEKGRIFESWDPPRSFSRIHHSSKWIEELRRYRHWEEEDFA